MTNLPEQVHGTAVATTTGAVDPYAIDQSMVKLPSLYLAQYSSKAFKARTVEFGDIYVAVGAEDPEPVVVGKHGQDALSEPVRFYVHAVQPGYQVADKDAPYGKRTLRLGTSYAQALYEGESDPRNVFLQTHYTLTVPAYEQWPVRFIMGSRWGGSAARWINTMLAMAKQKGSNPLELCFQLQTRPTSNDSGDFVDAVVGFASVAAKDSEADKSIIENHAMVLSSGTVSEDYQAETVQATEAPSLA